MNVFIVDSPKQRTRGFYLLDQLLKCYDVCVCVCLFSGTCHANYEYH